MLDDWETRSHAANAWHQPQNLPVAFDIFHAEALACFLQNVFMRLVNSLGMPTLVFVASARRVFIAGQIKIDLDDRNPVPSVWLEIHKRNLNHVVLVIFGTVGKYGRTKNMVQRGPFGGNILLDFLANNVSNGRIESSVVTNGSYSFLLLAAKSIVVVVAIS